jgi:DNA replication and repair protein RecF
LAKIFPVQVIDPEIHQLLEDGPRRRRMFLDWGVFHVEQSFHESWRRFNRALKQRNAQLKSGKSNFGVWDIELAVHGLAVTQFRQMYIQSFAAFLTDVGRRLLRAEISIEYSQGWRKNIAFSEALTESRLRDQQRGTTTVGPHRADLVLKMDGNIAKDRVSRGQQKMLACCLILAQQLHRASLSTQSACLLLDDPAAELDVDNLGRLLDLVGELPVQLIATTVNSANLSLFKNAKKFHVEHGSVKAVA